jgi:hypothetical protein
MALYVQLQGWTFLKLGVNLRVQEGFVVASRIGCSAQLARQA